MKINMGSFDIGFSNIKLSLSFGLFHFQQNSAEIFFQLRIHRQIGMWWIFAALLIVFPINLLCVYPISATSAVIMLLTRS